MKKAFALLIALMAASCLQNESLFSYKSKEEAIFQLAALKHANKNTEIFKKQVAEDLNISPTELELHSKLVLHFGKSGLYPIEKPSISEFTAQLEGDWRLTRRTILGERIPSSTWTLNRRTAREGIIESLTIDKTKGTRKEQLLGAYGTIRMETVSGHSYGLPKGTVALMQVFTYELIGHGYPSIQGVVQGKSEMLWVRQNGEYRTVSARIDCRDPEGKILEEMSTRAMVASSSESHSAISFPMIQGMDFKTKSVLNHVEAPLEKMWSTMLQEPNTINPEQWK